MQSMADVHSVQNCIELYMQRGVWHDYIYTRQRTRVILYQREIIVGDKNCIDGTVGTWT